MMAKRQVTDILRRQPMEQTLCKTVPLIRTQTLRFHSFTFTGKERDEETGYGYFGARYMDHELMTMWLSVDPMADKYPGISPYAYCAWNPVKYIDPDGDSVAVLLVNGRIGHMGILIQNNRGGWDLYSENGGEWPIFGSITGTPNVFPLTNDESDYKHTYDNVQDFLNNTDGNSRKFDGDRFPYYTQALVIPTTPEQDKIIGDAMRDAMKKYRLLNDNCAQAVLRSLEKAGVNTSCLYDALPSNSNRPFKNWISRGFTRILERVHPAAIFNMIRNAHQDDGVFIELTS